MSQPSWAAWIEIVFPPTLHSTAPACRSPLGLRGLKSLWDGNSIEYKLSQPSWAAWIEMFDSAISETKAVCRSPLGLRGLKY